MTCTAGEQVLARLMEGNRRLLGATINDGDISPAMRRTCARDGQHPLATVLACSDSRVVPEDAFMVGIGELFVVRVAGNVALGSQVASVVYGACHLGTPLVVVMGHTGCGAVAAALDAQDDQALACLVDPIRAAAAGTRDEREATVRNVAASVAALEAAPGLASRIAQGDLLVVGALYHIDTGRVELLRD